MLLENNSLLVFLSDHLTLGDQGAVNHSVIYNLGFLSSSGMMMKKMERRQLSGLTTSPCCLILVRQLKVTLKTRPIKHTVSSPSEDWGASTPSEEKTLQRTFSLTGNHDISLTSISSWVQSRHCWMSRKKKCDICFSSDSEERTLLMFLFVSFKTLKNSLKESVF